MQEVTLAPYNTDPCRPARLPSHRASLRSKVSWLPQTAASHLPSALPSTPPSLLPVKSLPRWGPQASPLLGALDEVEAQTHSRIHKRILTRVHQPRLHLTTLPPLPCPFASLVPQWRILLECAPHLWGAGKTLSNASCHEWMLTTLKKNYNQLIIQTLRHPTISNTQLSQIFQTLKYYVCCPFYIPFHSYQLPGESLFTHAHLRTYALTQSILRQSYLSCVF